MMKRLFLGLAVCALFLSYFGLLSPRIARAQEMVCYVFEVFLTNNGSSPGTATIFFADIDGNALTGTSSLTLNPGESGTLSLAAFVPAGIEIFPGGAPGSLDFDTFFLGPAPNEACGGGGFGRIGDGRINDGPNELAAPLAAYCADGGIAVWDISETGEGTLGFTATADEIAAALASATSSGQNVLVGEGLGNSLYALPTNELTLVGPDVKEPGKTYTFITGGDVCG